MASNLYPRDTAPNKSGDLMVSATHSIHWEEYGNPKGEPVIFLHGGPGSGFSPSQTRFFNPEKYRIIMFNQRGAGKEYNNKSPQDILHENNTSELVEDIEKLRKEVGIEKGTRAHIFGGSWGSTLSLVYAIAHPEHVKSLTLRGIFLGRNEDMNFLYGGGSFAEAEKNLKGKWGDKWDFFAEKWQDFIEPLPENLKPKPGEVKDGMAIMRFYNERLNSPDKDVRLDAARRMGVWEGASAKSPPNEAYATQLGDMNVAVKFSQIAAQYFTQRLFLAEANAPEQNYILENLGRIPMDIPVSIVHGEDDMLCTIKQAEDLTAAFKKNGNRASFTALPHSGHADSESRTEQTLTAVMDRLVGLKARSKLAMRVNEQSANGQKR